MTHAATTSSANPSSVSTSPTTPPPATSPLTAGPSATSPPPGGPPLVLAGGRGGLPTGQPAPGLRMLVYLRLHWLMIAFGGSLLATVAAYAAWELLASRYESYALLQVSSVPAALANANQPGQPRTEFVTYLKTTAALLRSEFVLNAALRDIRDLPTIRRQKDPIKFLDEELIVQWQDGSEVVRIAFKSREPEDARRIVDAVQKAFMSEVVQRDVQEKQYFLRKVEEAQLELRKILDRKAERPLAGQAPAGGDGGVLPAAGAAPANAPPAAGNVPNPPAAGAAPGDNPLAAGNAPPAGAAPAGGIPLPPPQTAGLVPAAALLPPEPAGWDRLLRSNPGLVVNKVQSLLQEIERLPIEINHAQRRLAVLREKMEAIKNAPVSDLTLQLVEKDPEVAAQVQRTRQALREYEFRRNAAADPQAPGVLQLKAAYEAQEAALAALRKEKSDAIERNRRLADAQKVAAEMEETIRTIQRLQEQWETAKAILARTERQLLQLPLGEKVASDSSDGRLYRPEWSDLDSTDSIYRRLVQQYYLTRLELDSPPRVRVIQSASTPIQRDVKKQIVGTVFAALLSYLLVALAAVGYETLTQRLNSLEDVRQHSRLLVAGVIPGKVEHAFSTERSRRVPVVEAVDRLRAHVAQAWLARGVRTIAVTNPLHDDGRTTIAFALAASLAHSGVRTLLIDGDVRQPRLHRLAGCGPQTSLPQGLCELLRGEAEWTAVVQQLANGLHVLPAGAWTEATRHSLSGEQWQTLLQRLRDNYSCIIIHTHALLAAAEALDISHRCDALLLCVRYRESTVPLLQRAEERIAALQLSHSGVVYVGATVAESLC